MSDYKVFDYDEAWEKFWRGNKLPDECFIAPGYAYAELIATFVEEIASPLFARIKALEAELEKAEKWAFLVSNSKAVHYSRIWDQDPLGVAHETIDVMQEQYNVMENLMLKAGAENARLEAELAKHRRESK